MQVRELTEVQSLRGSEVKLMCPSDDIDFLQFVDCV